MRIRLLLTAALTAGVLAANTASANVTASEKDAGKIVSVKQGEPLVVKLKGHAGSGYYWRLDADLTPQLILSGRSTEALAFPGSPQVTIFTFTTAAPGDVSFKASNLHAGDPIPTSSEIVFTVSVTP